MLLGGFFGGRAWAVEDRDDDGQGKGVGSSKLGELSGLGDTAESVRGCNGNGGFHGVFGVKLALDFHCQGRLDQRSDNKLGMKKSSMDGNCYLVYLWALLVYKIVVLVVLRPGSTMV